MKDIPKTWHQTGKQFEIFRQKKIKNTSSFTKQPHKTQGPQMQQLTTDPETGKKKPEEKLKKAFRLNLLEIARLELRSQVQTCSPFM